MRKIFIDVMARILIAVPCGLLWYYGHPAIAVGYLMYMVTG